MYRGKIGECCIVASDDGLICVRWVISCYLLMFDDLYGYSVCSSVSESVEQLTQSLRSSFTILLGIPFWEGVGLWSR